MKLLYGVLLFVGVFALNNAASPMTLKRIETDQLLMQRLMRASKGDPSLTMQCFNLYVPALEAIMQEFSKSYQLCASNAEAQNNELDKEASGNRTLISTSAQNICNKMIDCSALDSLEFFDCYANEGSGNTKALYGLTNTAIEVAAYLREEHQVVENNMRKCENASERAYVEETAATKDALDNCLLNGPPEVVTTTASPVETTTISEVTSPAPEAGSTAGEVVTPDVGKLEEEDLTRSAPSELLNKYKRFGIF